MPEPAAVLEALLVLALEDQADDDELQALLEVAREQAPDPEGRGEPTNYAHVWEEYLGPKKGHGWINELGEVKYQPNKPDPNEGGDDDGQGRQQAGQEAQGKSLPRFHGEQQPTPQKPRVPQGQRAPAPSQSAPFPQTSFSVTGDPDLDQFLLTWTGVAREASARMQAVAKFYTASIHEPLAQVRRRKNELVGQLSLATDPVQQDALFREFSSLHRKALELSARGTRYGHDLLATLAVSTPGELTVAPGSINVDHFDEAKEFWETVSVRPLSIRFVQGQGERQGGTGGTVWCDPDTPADVLLHEIGHTVEEDPHLLRLVEGFHRHRLQGEVPVRLNQMASLSYLRDDEYGARDDWEKLFPDAPENAWYMGKAYYTAQGQFRGCEIIPMGLELLYRDAGRVALTDPELFTFLLGVLRTKPS